MVIDELSADLGAAELVDALADPHRCFQAYQRLCRLGPAAGSAARRGLEHPSAQVREYCCQVLDHLMDADNASALLEALDDPAERVRLAAAHALACERCKDGAWRPASASVLPRAIALLGGRRIRPCARDGGRAGRAVGAHAPCRVHGHRAGRIDRSCRLGQEEGGLVRAWWQRLPAHAAAPAPAAALLAFLRRVPAPPAERPRPPSPASFGTTADSSGRERRCRHPRKRC